MNTVWIDASNPLLLPGKPVYSMSDKNLRPLRGDLSGDEDLYAIDKPIQKEKELAQL